MRHQITSRKSSLFDGRRRRAHEKDTNALLCSSALFDFESLLEQDSYPLCIAEHKSLVAAPNRPRSFRCSKRDCKLALMDWMFDIHRSPASSWFRSASVASDHAWSHSLATIMCHVLIAEVEKFSKSHLQTTLLILSRPSSLCCTSWKGERTSRHSCSAQCTWSSISLRLMLSTDHFSLYSCACLSFHWSLQLRVL